MLRRCPVPLALLFLALVSLADGGIDVGALDVTLTNPDSAGAFTRVASSSTGSYVVDKHNDVRAEVLASNMEYVDQTGNLTGDVNAWLSQCSYADAMVVHWDSAATYPYVNGFKAMSSSQDSIIDIINIISWMPTSSKFYKLLMKSDIRYIGCGSVQCPLPRSQYTLIACLYASRSNLNLTEAPYKIGEPCTECSSGIFWCDDNLCRENCYTSNAHCECRIDCGRYSSVTSNCSCLCSSGYKGTKCQQETTTVRDADWASDWTESGTTLVVSVTLILLALLAGSLCLMLYHKKYRLSKPSPEASLESESSARRTSIYSTSSSSSFDPSKYPSLPPAYSAISPTTGLDPPPYVFTASPTDAAEEVGEGPPPYQQINV